MNAMLRILLVGGVLVLLIVLLGLTWNLLQDVRAGSYRASLVIYGASIALSAMGIGALWKRLNA